MKKDECYFSHDANAKDDPKIMLLVDQLGLEGYGIFWVLVETLRNQPEYKYPLVSIPPLARRYNTSAEIMNTVVSKYGLFEVDEEENFFSYSLNRRMEHLESYREKKRQAGIKSGEARKQKALLEQRSNTVQTLNEHRSNKSELSKVKKSKVKESKEKGILKGYDFDSFWSDYGKSAGVKARIEKKFNALSEETREEIKAHVSRYVLSTPDKQFRKDPSTYLNNEGWTDEIIDRSNGKQPPTTTSPNQPLFIYKINGERKKHSDQKRWQRDKDCFEQVDCYEEIEIRK